MLMWARFPWFDRNGVPAIARGMIVHNDPVHPQFRGCGFPSFRGGVWRSPKLLARDAPTTGVETHDKRCAFASLTICGAIFNNDGFKLRVVSRLDAGVRVKDGVQADR